MMYLEAKSGHASDLLIVSDACPRATSREFSEIRRRHLQHANGAHFPKAGILRTIPGGAGKVEAFATQIGKYCHINSRFHQIVPLLQDHSSMLTAP